MSKRKRKTIQFSKKKRKVNKFKVAKVLLALVLVIFLGIKATKTTVALVQDITLKIFKEENQKTAVKSSSQYELADEAKKIEGKYTILIDPGHGGNDAGSNNALKTIYEKDLTLKIGQKIASKLSKQKDIQVMITRNIDKYVSLKDRTAMANNNNVDLFVSIHLNGEQGGNSAYGLETYYRPKAIDNSPKVAQLVQESIVSYVGSRDRGCKPANYEVLRDTNMEAILVECGFISNADDEKKLTNSKYQDQFADGVVQGILSYIDNYKNK